MSSLCAKITLTKAGPQLFYFPGEERLRKKWSAFGCRADKEFTSIKNLDVCSKHYETKQILKTLSGIKRPARGTVPTIFNQQTVRRSPNQREKGRMRGQKQDTSDDSIDELATKIFHVSTDISLKDYNYFLKENKV